ncbi:MAG TPA: class I SAM-dependent methyltransferase [Chitinophagaceae bacterium]|nr:class I SAM-dependent methyltransferase [Chitinophagaceae bacterium]
MFSNISQAFKYLNFFLTAKSRHGHGIHSPFVFHFIEKVLCDKNAYPEYVVVENLRKDLLHDKRKLPYTDLGAGSKTGTGDQRSIASIARHSAKSKKCGQLLFRIVRKYSPAHILELGTSLGVTTSYLALGNRDGHVSTIEGVESVAGEASRNFKKSGLDNVHLYNGNFDDTLTRVLQDHPIIDLAFIDGNHREEPTLRYFNTLAGHCNNDTLLIFDDIHWSLGMEKAWQAIKEHPATLCTIDLFYMGIVLFRKEFREKQHFRIRF